MTNTELRAERDALVKDAVRYRIARTLNLVPRTDSITPQRPDKFDLFIDAAMKEKS